MIFGRKRTVDETEHIQGSGDADTESTSLLPRLLDMRSESDQRLINSAAQAKITQESPDFALMLRLSDDVPSDVKSILVISDDSSALPLAGAIAAFWPSARVRLLTSPQVPAEFPAVIKTPVSSVNDIFNAVAAGPAPGLIIEDARNRSFQRYGVFKRTFLALCDGGTYVSLHSSYEVDAAGADDTTDTAAQWTSAFMSSPSNSSNASAWERVANDALARATQLGPHLVLRKQGQHLMKINSLLHRPGGEAGVEACVARRAGADAVERIASIPARTWEVRSDFETTDETYAHRYLKDTYNVRELVAKVYKGAVLAPRQVITMSGLLLPESSMQPLVRPMLNRFITDAGPEYALDPRFNVEPKLLQGTFFHLDNEYPGHYGHFTSQDLTKLWAWDAALEYDTDCRILASAPPGRDDLHPYQYRLLSAFGIPRDRVTVFTSPVRVERLVNATFALQNPYFASPVCKEVWGRVRDRILPESRAEVPKRVFVGRSGGLRRRCINSDDVERVFIENGFEVVYPETLDIADQIKMFSQAEAVAGYAGSGMFTMAYSQQHPTWIVLGSKSYTATTEYLLAGLYDDPIRYVMCEPEVPQPVSGWSSAAYFSDYRFDFDRDGKKLDSILSRI